MGTASPPHAAHFDTLPTNKDLRLYEQMMANRGRAGAGRRRNEAFG